MLHAAQAGCYVPGPYAMSLHREHAARRARMSLAAIHVVRRAISWPTEILVYPVHVFADDCDRAAPLPSVSRVREIQDLICNNLKVGRNDLLSARRERAVVVARQIGMYLCKVHTANSLPEIGRRFGGRDHTTVLHGIRRVSRMMATPSGTSISPHWSIEACDFVRETVNLAEITISTWPESFISHVRYPARSAA